MTHEQMGIYKFFRNIPKALQEPSRLPLHSTQSNTAKSYKSLVYNRNTSGFSPIFHFNSQFFPKSELYTTQSSNLYDAPFRDAYSNLNPDARITQQSEIICKLVSENGKSRNLDSSLANFCDLSPRLVLEVLKKLNNAGILALSFFRWAEKQKSFEHTPECYNALIESLGKSKQFKVVWILVDEMRKKGLLSKETFALVSRRLARAMKVAEAIQAFENMEKRYGFKLELQDYNRLLDTLSKSGHVEKAQEVFDKWRDQRFKPDIKSYTILLEGWGQECNFLRLNEVYREMREDGFEPDVVSYGILIKAYFKVKRIDESIALFNEMDRKNIKATPHIYCTLINGLGSEKRLNEAINFFESYKSSDCVLDAPTYNAMVGAYCWSMRIHDAYRIVDEMRKCGIGPNTRTYDIILRHLIKSKEMKEAYNIFQKISDESGVEPSVSTYEIMVRMFCNEEQSDMAMKVWDQMKSRGLIPRMHMFSALINGLCNENKLDAACKYFQEMLDMGIRPPDFMFQSLKQALLDEGKKDDVLVFAHKINKLKNSPLFS